MNRINDEAMVKRQYKTAHHLHTRISIHDQYSTNKIGFKNWIISHYQIEKGMKVLEIGCGTGDIWKNRESLIKMCSPLILSDFSKGMLDAAKAQIGNHPSIKYQVLDIQNIPYPDDAFDMVIANMMLYHVPDLNQGLREVRRVLRKDSRFYCATYGEHGIIEYLSKIFSAYGVQDHMNKNFTLQNGYEILHSFFPNVEKFEYPDSLAVTNLDDIIEYIASLSSMTALSDLPKQEIKDLLMMHTQNGVLQVPKEYGMFIAS